MEGALFHRQQEFKLRDSETARSPEVDVRTRLLEQFTPKNPIVLQEVIAQKERAFPRERLLWEAVEWMMRDEIMRNQLLDRKQQGSSEPVSEELQMEYQKILAGYRTIVELAFQAGNEEAATREIIPFVTCKDIRTRLADLLANEEFYLEQPSMPERRKQALIFLEDSYREEAWDGRKAELATIGLLRYGREWLRGGETGDDHLKPAMFVERVLPREDVLRKADKNARFSQQDIIFQIPGEQRIRFVQMKSGALMHKAHHVNVSAIALNSLWERVGISDVLRNGKLNEPGYVDRGNYTARMEDLMNGLPLEQQSRLLLRKQVIPQRKRLISSERRKRSPVYTLQNIRQKLDSDPRFQDFARQHGAPPHIDQANFPYWADLFRRAQQTHPHLTKS